MDITILIGKIKEAMHEWFPFKSEIPTKTSDLLNDNNFININHIHIPNKIWITSENDDPTIYLMANDVTRIYTLIIKSTTNKTINAQSNISLLSAGQIAGKYLPPNPINVPLPKANCIITLNKDGSIIAYNYSSSNVTLAINTLLTWHTDTQMYTNVDTVSATGVVDSNISTTFNVMSGNTPVTEGTLTTTIDGQDFSSVVRDGQATFTFNFNQAKQINNNPVYYNGTDQYYASVGYLNLTVQKINTKITMLDDTSGTSSGDNLIIDWILMLTDVNNNPIPNKTIKYYLDNTLKTSATTSSNGEVTIRGTVSLTNSHTFKFVFEGDTKYQRSEHQEQAT